MRKKIFYIVFVTAVLVISAAVIVYSLIEYHVIHIEKPYEPKYISLEDYGSASRLEGNIAAVIIFADCEESSWDFDKEEDAKKRRAIFEQLDVAFSWIEEQGSRYGKNIKIFYPESEESDCFYYEAKFDEPLPCDYYNVKERSAAAESDFVRSNVNFKLIREKYDCDEFAYLIFYNTTSETGFGPFAYCCYDEELKNGYEFCYLPYDYGEYTLCPSTIAHEFLHLFGAMDMYVKTNSLMTPQIYDPSPASYDYFSENFSTDIMFSTKSPLTDVRESDKIDNEITDVTAYYIGWTDFPSDIIDELHLVHSQFDKP